MRTSGTSLAVLSALLLALPAARLAAEEAAPAAPSAPADGAQDSESDKKDGEAPVTVSWKDGHVTFESDGGSLTISNRIQFRYTLEMPDDKNQLPGTTKNGASRGSFRIRRAKTELEGWVWHKDVEYALQIGWAAADSGPSAGGTFSGLEDAYLNWNASKDGRFQVRAGQFKVPFGRQEMTSSESQQFVDRDILSFEFTKSRDVGLMVWGQVAEGKVDYRLGLFNGNQRNKAGNDNAKYQLDARITLQPWGDVKYSEGDFESKDKPLFAIAGEFEQNDTEGATNAVDYKTTIFGGDAVFKYKGFSLFAEYFARDRDPETVVPTSTFEPSGPQPPSFGGNGWHMQAGYFLKRNVFEVAFRYAAYDPSDIVADNDRSEVGGGVNWFFNKHRLKLQADFRQLKDDQRDTKDNELRTQLQLVF